MVNSVIGDESFKYHYHINPLPFSLFTSLFFEDFRIQTHLLFVHKFLTTKDCSSLSEELKINRIKGLHYLEQYARACVFPRNYVCLFCFNCFYSQKVSCYCNARISPPSTTV